MGHKTIGVLVMSYGTPVNMDDVETYYTHIRRGRPPTPEALKELTDRYEAIGGTFPLRSHTDRQVKQLENSLNERDPSNRYVCYQGLKHAPPYIEDGVQQMAADGIKQAIGIVLAPHYSKMSVGSYIERAQLEAEKHQVDMAFVESYHLHPKLVQAWSERVVEGLNKFTGVDREQVRVMFSAHSLPAKILETGDPYLDQMLESCRAIEEQTGVDHWQFVWQSAGQTATPWLGPDILDVLRSVRSEGVEHVLVCPIGFVSDHLEILYDIDIECKQLSEKIGLHLHRTESLNTDPRYMQTLAECVLEKL